VSQVLVQLARLGDVVQCLPLCRALRRQGELTLVLSFDPGQALRREADHTVVLDLPALMRLRDHPAHLRMALTNSLGTISRVRHEGVFCLNADSLASGIAALIPARRRAGAGCPLSAYHQWLHVLPKHRRENQLHLCEAMLSLTGSDESGPWPARTPGSGRILVHPGSGSECRRMPLAFWVQVVEGLLPAGREILLTGSATERSLCDEIVARSPGAGRVSTCAGETSLDDLVALLDDATLLIAQDTGVLHLGAWRSCPLLALYHASAWARETAPWQEGAHVLQALEECSPCHEGRPACEELPCRQQLDPGEVAELAMAIVAGRDMRLPHHPGRRHLRCGVDAVGLELHGEAEQRESETMRRQQWKALHGHFDLPGFDWQRATRLREAAEDAADIANWRRREWPRPPAGLLEKWAWMHEGAMLGKDWDGLREHAC